MAIQITIQAGSLSNAAPNEREVFDALNILTKVQYFDLSYNNLTSVPDHAFKNAKDDKLSTVSVGLAHNAISRVGSHVFHWMPKLERIDLGGNPIEVIETAAVLGGSF